MFLTLRGGGIPPLAHVWTKYTFAAFDFAKIPERLVVPALAQVEGDRGQVGQPVEGGGLGQVVVVADEAAEAVAETEGNNTRVADSFFDIIF